MLAVFPQAAILILKAIGFDLDCMVWSEWIIAM
jgi:hypothetical protein